MEQGGVPLALWIVGSTLLLIISILIVWSAIRQPRAMPLWLALLNPIILNLLVGGLGALSDIGRSYIVPMAANLAHLSFFLGVSWCLHSGQLRQLNNGLSAGI